MHAMAASPTLNVPACDADEARAAAGTAAEVYARHADFVWASLSRLGVAHDDLPDQLQEVFLVVHRRLDSYDGTCAVTTWLFGICLRVASMWRRHRKRHPEDVTDTPPEREDHRSPEGEYARRQAAVTLARALDALTPEKRAVFVMFEVDELSCDEIAEVLGVPKGTVFTRLRAARQQFEAIAARLRAKDHWEEGRR